MFRSFLPAIIKSAMFQAMLFPVGFIPNLIMIFISWILHACVNHRKIYIRFTLSFLWDYYSEHKNYKRHLKLVFSDNKLQSSSQSPSNTKFCNCCLVLIQCNMSSPRENYQEKLFWATLYPIDVLVFPFFLPGEGLCYAISTRIFENFCL